MEVFAIILVVIFTGFIIFEGVSIIKAVKAKKRKKKEEETPNDDDRKEK